MMTFRNPIATGVVVRHAVRLLRVTRDGVERVVEIRDHTGKVDAEATAINDGLHIRQLKIQLVQRINLALRDRGGRFDLHVR